jgi:hypothetical protein
MIISLARKVAAICLQRRDVVVVLGFDWDLRV